VRAVIQRVTQASVTIDNAIVASIQKGLLILIGIEEEEHQEDIDWIAFKIVNLRIFADQNRIMNLSVKDIVGDIILVSQFTLYASTKKGNRPSCSKAAKPEIAIPVYEELIQQFETKLERKIQTGKFGADMKVAILNDGPVTIIMDTKNRE